MEAAGHLETREKTLIGSSEHGRRGTIFDQITRALIALPLLLAQPGCAVHYYNPDTGVEHLIGFGHMKMKVQEPNEGVRAIVTGTETIGVAAGTIEEGVHFAAGWNRSSRLKAIDKDTSVRFEWPTNSLINVRVGSLPPGIEEEDKEALLEIVAQKGTSE